MGEATATRAEGTPDPVITGAVILDHRGVIKADIGIRDGRIGDAALAILHETIAGSSSPDIRERAAPAPRPAILRVSRAAMAR